jgi:hypothetical protein
MTNSVLTVTEPKPSKLRIIGFWLITAFLLFELVYGAFWDFNVLNKGFVYKILTHLGYPLYFAPFLGVTKLLAAPATVITKFNPLTEWAYAGVVFIFAGASFSHLAAGDSVATAAVPFVFVVLAISSRLLHYFLSKKSDNI